MYASRTVCSRCSSQWRSTPVSASASTKRLGAAASYSTADETRSLASSRPNNTSRDSRSRHPGQRKGVNAFKESRQPDEDIALALFKEVVSPKEVKTPTDTTFASTPLPQSELEITTLINTLISPKVPVEKMYRIFKDEIWPGIKALGGHIPKPIYTATLQLLAKQRHYMLERADHNNSLDIAQKYSALGVYDLSIRNDLILSMCCKIVQVKNNSKDRSEMRTMILNLWKHVSQLKRPSQVGRTLRFVLPSATEVMKDISEYIKIDGSMSREEQATRALASIFLQFPPPQAQEIIPALLATMATVSDKRFAGPSHMSMMSPLFFLIKHVLSEYRMTQSGIEAAFSKPSAVSPPRLNELKEYVVKQWPTAVKMISAAQQETTFYHDPDAHRSLMNFHRQVRTAYKRRDPGAVGSIWHSMTAKLQDSPAFKAELAGDSEFLDFWAFVWCAIRRPIQAQETITLMKSLKLEPTVRTYTSMMHGWKMCKDISKIEMLWDQLVKSGTKLDSFIWTERVSALIELGQHQKGLEALSELLDNWRQAVKDGTQDQAVEPSIETVNAAFKGLLHTDAKAAHELLGWAGKQGIEPNTRTYNILIRETIRLGHHEEINKLLRSMQAHGIEPDSATFTILLETIIGSMHDASAKEQVSAIKSVFNEIEQAGLKPNLETYGKVLYALDGLPNCSDDVIAALQQHMRGNGFGSRLTPHMITILIERALRHNPPDVNKIRSLLKENNLTTVSSGDQTLWERVTAAHAISGNVKEAMAIFDDLAASGRPVTSLPSLTELIQALIQHGDRETAQRVVDVVVNHKLKDNEKAARQRYWKHHFWYIAQYNGLIDGAKLRQYSSYL